MDLVNPRHEDTFVVKIADFGAAKNATVDNKTDTLCGTYCNLAPEIFFHNR